MFKSSLLLLLLTTSIQAYEWEFEVSPYIWAVNQQGQTGYVDENGRPIIADLDMSFNDALDNLDSAAFLHFQARREEWQFWIDLSYMKLKNEVKGDFTRGKLTSKQRFLDGVLAYRFLKQSRVEWYSYIGARFADVENSLSSRLTGEDRTDKFEGDWIDPLIGLKNHWDLNKTFYLNSRAEIGGFGVGSDFSWGVGLTLNQMFAQNWAIKYHADYTDIDYDDKNFLFDIQSSRVGLGVSYFF